MKQMIIKKKSLLNFQATPSLLDQSLKITSCAQSTKWSLKMKTVMDIILIVRQTLKACTNSMSTLRCIILLPMMTVMGRVYKKGMI